MTSVQNILDELDCKLTKLHLETCSENLPLYHYTNAAGLMGILTSGKIWLTDCCYLNDPGEIIFGRNYIFEILKQYEKEFSWITEMEKQIKEDIFHKHMSNVYVCSFCAMYDYLPAWRYYGDDGFGFAIEFSTDFFKPNEKIDLTKNHATITDILYDDIRINEANYTSFLARSMEEIRQAITKISDVRKMDDHIISRIKIILTSHLMALFPSIKHCNYKTEKEWRLFMYELFNNGERISPPRDDDFEKDTFKREVKKTISKSIYPLITACSQKIDVPYIKMKIKPTDISRIYVGPAYASSKKIISELTELLQSLKDFNHVGIKPSNIKYNP